MRKFLRFRVLLAVGAILFAMGAAYNAMHTSQGLHGALRGEPPLDPAAYRPQIVDVEALLFSPAPLTMEDRIRLAQSMDVLRKELEQRGGTEMAKFSAREMGTLAGMSRGLGDLQGAQLEAVRNNWMRIRSNTFQDDAAWFRFSESDPVPPREVQKVVLSESDRTALANLTSRLNEIDEAIARGTRECERLGEPESGMDESRGEALAQAWKDWAVSWNNELQHIHNWMPDAPGPDAPAALRSVYSSASEALAQLESIPNAGAGRWNVPYRQDWERRFQGAAKKVRDARFWIERGDKGIGV